MADDKNLRASTNNTPEALCRTKIQTETLCYKWIIENFLHCPVECLTSTVFELGENFSWFHNLWTKKYDSSCKRWNIEIGTIMKSCDKNNSHYATMKMQHHELILTSTGQVQASCYLGQCLKINRTDIINERNVFLKNDALELCFEMTISRNLPSQKINPQIKLANSQLLPNMNSLFTDEKFTDMKIIVGTRDFRCHKAFLAARSPVFAAMFEHEMEESLLGQVVITDTEPKVFEQFLRFIYTDSVHDLAKYAVELLPVADKYAVDRLKTLCEENLAATLCVESVVVFAALADVLHAEQLKRACIEFICKNSAVLETEHWNNLCDRRRDLFNEILKEIMKQIK